MKQNIKYILLSLLVLLMVSCQKSQEYYEGLYVVGADQLSPVANLTIDDLPAVIGIKVASSCAIGDHVEVGMKATPELVESFNKEYKKNYELLPEKSYKLENTTLTIENGKNTSTDGVRLSVISRDLLKEGKTYLLPISIVSVSDKNLSVIEPYTLLSIKLLLLKLRIFLLITGISRSISEKNLNTIPRH